MNSNAIKPGKALSIRIGGKQSEMMFRWNQEQTGELELFLLFSRIRGWGTLCCRNAEPEATHEGPVMAARIGLAVCRRFYVRARARSLPIMRPPIGV